MCPFTIMDFGFIYLFIFNPLSASPLGEEVRERERRKQLSVRMKNSSQVEHLQVKHQEDQGRDFLLSQTEQGVPSSPHT